MRLASLLAVLLLSTATVQAKEIGKVVAVEGHASIERLGVQTTAIKDLMLEASDVIRTEANSTISFILTDGTSFMVGSNAEMSLDQFSFDAKANGNKALIDLRRGVFTFLAGKVAKTGDMKVTTPVGTMGIRGTAPHVEILPDGTVKFGTLIEERK